MRSSFALASTPFVTPPFRCRPVPVLRPELLAYVARMYGAWSPAVSLLHSQLLALGHDNLRPARLQVSRLLGQRPRRGRLFTLCAYQLEVGGLLVGIGPAAVSL